MILRYINVILKLLYSYQYLYQNLSQERVKVIEFIVTLLGMIEVDANLIYKRDNPQKSHQQYLEELIYELAYDNQFTENRGNRRTNSQNMMENIYSEHKVMRLTDHVKFMHLSEEKKKQKRLQCKVCKKRSRYCCSVCSTSQIVYTLCNTYECMKTHNNNFM